MLVVTLVEKEQISGYGLLPLPGQQPRVFLYEFEGAGVGAARPIGQPPLIAQGAALGRRQFQFRWQHGAGQAHGLLPFHIVAAQGFGDREAYQAGAVAMLPPRRRALVELGANDAREPGAEGP